MEGALYPCPLACPPVSWGGGSLDLWLYFVMLQKGDVVECEIDEIGTIRNVIQ